jgi:histidyl-tRNA synthetase
VARPVSGRIDRVSGFPEFLPEERLVEQGIIDQIRAQFELFGFTPIETRAVEPLDQLLRKGETDKEIYTIRRLQAEEAEQGELGLHFDLTVPLARYVAQHQGKLDFPFKRYQIQKSWRGERPQEGRYREFLQADIDVIDQGELALHFDAEMVVVLHQVMEALPFPPVVLRVNNRKIFDGFAQGMGRSEVDEVIRTLDKLDKIGPDGVAGALTGLGVGAAELERWMALALIESPDDSFRRDVKALGVEHPLLDEGLDELAFVMRAVSHLPPGRVLASLGIARGFDYYTGTVFEGQMEGHESLGSVCSGGRYDDLVGGEGGHRLPGVGASIGVTRILVRLLNRGELPVAAKTPTVVVVALPSEEERAGAEAVARSLRARGIATEVFHEPARYGKQIRYASRKGIPYVWFPATGGEGHSVRDIRSGDQLTADPGSWGPPVP